MCVTFSLAYKYESSFFPTFALAVIEILVNGEEKSAAPATAEEAEDTEEIALSELSVLSGLSYVGCCCCHTHVHTHVHTRTHTRVRAQ